MAEIVGIVTGFLGPAIKLVKYIAAPIQRQFNYLCCFNSNIQNLKDEANKLDVARDGLQMQVDTAKNRVEVPLPKVEDWLTKANNIREEKSSIEDEIPKVQSGCLSIKARFLVSKKATKAAERMKELREACIFESVSVPAPPAATEPDPSETSYNFESRKQIEDDIMTTLRNKNVNMIGIWGMGGVGKTTMAKRIMEIVLEEHLFDEVEMAVVSQNVDMLKIQQEIAEPLGLKLEDQTLRARAHKLRKRLRDEKTKLLVLDDVWKSLKLEDLGIPCESEVKGRKILLTSRNRDALTAMNVQKICGLQILSKGEAWFLFREKVGTCVDDLKLHSIANEVVKECKGLPIALATVGVALKDENKISVWEDALQQLKRASPDDIPDVIEEVYNPLELSYRFLPNEHAKSLFLLCCLFPEDDNIPLEYLTYFAMGLHMFEGISKLEEARKRTDTLIKVLKSRFLLLDGSDEYHVRVHDVVRDVSIFIAKKERYINCNDCTWISSFVRGRAKLPLGSGLPNLRLLFIDNKGDEEFQVSDSFIEGTRELNVLFIMYSALGSLPHTTYLLKNLRTLVLYSCDSLETVSTVGKLDNLEILVCRYCDSIKELSLETGRQNCLKLLEISNCGELQRIALGVMSMTKECLLQLEGLEIKYCDRMEQVFLWNKEENEKNIGQESHHIAIFPMLKSIKIRRLKNLTAFCKGIERIGFPLITEMEIQYCPQWKGLVSSSVGINTARADDIDDDDDHSLHLLCNLKVSSGNLKKLQIVNPGNTTSENAFCHQIPVRFFTGLEELTIGNFDNIKCLFSSSIAQKLFNLRKLSIERCQKMMKVIEDDKKKEALESTICLFPSLEELHLFALHELKSFCEWKCAVELPSLKYVHIAKCCQMQRFTLGSLTTPSLESFSIFCVDNIVNTNDFIDALQIQRFYIRSCQMMGQVVLLSNEEENQRDIGQSDRGCHINFSKLKELYLDDLSGLTTFCRGIESIEFPLLTKMGIGNCPNLKSLVYTTSSSGGIKHDDDNDDSDSLHLFCNAKVTFGSLKELKISYSNTLRIWCHQIPINFFTVLEILRIEHCDSIRSLLSSRIAQSLDNLKQLEIRFCSEIVQAIEEEDEDACGGETCLFPNLKELRLTQLPQLKSFCQWRCALQLPSLEFLKIYRCPKMERFCLGSLTTPNLRRVLIDDKDLRNVEDLNGACNNIVLKQRGKNHHRVKQR